MNAKEEVIDILKYIKETSNNDIDYLITAVENAIFDVPSVEVHGHSEFVNGFRDGCNFILNYKKPKSDGK